MNTTARPRVSWPAQRRSGWVPNQHGAWFILAAPVIVGVATSTPALTHLPLTLFWFAGYFAFFSVTTWLKARRAPRYRVACLTYCALTGVMALLVLALNPGLVRYAWWFVGPLAVGLYAASARQDRAWWAGLTMVATAALFTPVVHAAGHGDSPGIWRSTALLAGYFLGTVLFVKSMIRERSNHAFLRISIAAHLAIAVGETLIAWWLAPFFLALTARAALLPRRRMTPKTVGIQEMLWSLGAVVLAVLIC